MNSLSTDTTDGKFVEAMPSEHQCPIPPPHHPIAHLLISNF